MFDFLNHKTYCHAPPKTLLSLTLGSFLWAAFPSYALGPDVESTSDGSPRGSLFRETALPVPRVLDLEPHGSSSVVWRDMQAGPLEGNVQGPSAGLNLGLPFSKGFNPEEADLKLGPMLFKLGYLRSALLVSDNIRRSNTDRDADAIAIGVLSGTALLQLGEGFQLATTGALVYFPLENKLGFTTGFDDLLMLGAIVDPALRAQASYDLTIGGWTVLLSDDFRVDRGRYYTSTRDDFGSFDGIPLTESDRAGHYVFTAPNLGPERDWDDPENGSDFTVYSNTIRATAETLFRADTRITLRASHQDLWYDTDDEYLPSGYDRLYARAASQRENMRFKPFAAYGATRISYDGENRGWDQTAEFGFSGPITDQLFLYASAGGFIRGDSSDLSALYQLRLDHIAGSFTRESLALARTVDEYSDTINQTIIYNLHQVLGPDLRGDLFVEYTDREPIDRDFAGSRIFRTGVRLSYLFSPKTDLRLAGIYNHAEIDDDGGSYDTWTGRLELRHRFASDLESRLLYQYQQRDADVDQDSYYENLVMLSVTKFF